MNTGFQNFLIVFLKEFQDNLRDRRSLASTLMTTLIGPIALTGMIVLLGKTLLQDNIEKPLELAVIGAENAPTLIQYLQQNNVTLLDSPSDPEAQVRAGDLTLAIVIPPDYSQAFETGEPAPLKIILDTSRQTAMRDIQRARTLIAGYSATIGSLRLLARGIDPQLLNPIQFELVDVATPESQANIFLNMMPYFIVLIVFTGGMHVVIDSTAGERERNSLEPLLINPALRRDIVLGKMAAAVPFATLSVAITLLAFAAAFNLIPLEEYVGFQISIGLNAILGIFIIALPMILFASAIQMVVVSFTRSFKEAQTSTAFLPLIPAMPGILIGFMAIKPTLWHMLIPTFGQQMLINQYMRGEAIDPLNMLVSALVCLLWTAVAAWLAVRLYQRERIIQGAR